MFAVVPSYVGEKIYLDDTNSIKPPLEGLAKDMNDFELAIFNECCVPNHWNGQNAAVPCTGNNTNDCQPINDQRVLAALGNIDVKTVLCSCASSADRLAGFMTSIRNTGFCAKAKKALINVSSLKLPAKAGGFALRPLTLRYGPKGSQTYTYVPLVGFHLSVLESLDEADPVKYPYGCGIGYQKGVSWMIDNWFQQHAPGASYGSIACGLLNLIMLATGIAISVMQGKEDREYSDGKVDKWEATKDIPSTFASTNPLHHQVANVGQVNSTRSGNNSALNSEHNSARNSVAGSAGQGLDRAVVFEQLRGFYAKYDKGKNLADVEDVTTWTVVNGIAAINAKLMSKYNADLSTVNSSDGVGAKALQQDLDI